MLKIKDLKFGLYDAIGYLDRNEKMFLKDVFVEIEEIDRICKSPIYYLIGEKGTGKTTYATYLSNQTYRSSGGSCYASFTTSISATEYDKFITLKKNNHLHLSGYQNIWKVVLLLLISGHIVDNHEKKWWELFDKFDKLKKIIDEFYSKAFSPEMLTAISFVEDTKLSVDITNKYLKSSYAQDNNEKYTHNSYQTDLLRLEQAFKDGIKSLKLDKNFILFVDGIDVRPETIPYDDYLECVKGLANAMWSLNHDFFANIKDSKGRIKIVLLLRPDIFNSLNLQNSSSKLNDNAIEFNWQTTYEEYRTSQLFKLANKLLSYGQDKNCESFWDFYFPFKVARQDNSQGEKDNSFILILRNSFYRPRDIIAQLSILKSHSLIKNKEALIFSQEDFSNEFRRNYSEYLLGEIKDYLKFYFSDREYESFINFFSYLNGQASFSYESFLIAFKHYSEKSNDLPSIFSTPDKLLQFLYDLNIIGYQEYIEGRSTPLVRWSFREKTFAHMSPQVQTQSTYVVHSGLLKALNLGRKVISL